MKKLFASLLVVAFFAVASTAYAEVQAGSTGSSGQTKTESTAQPGTTKKGKKHHKKGGKKGKKATTTAPAKTTPPK